MDERREQRRLEPAGHVFVAALIGLLVASLFSARSLEAVAERQEQGAVRSIALAITRPLVTLSSTLLLDRPRVALDAVLGRTKRGGEIRAPRVQPAKDRISTPSFRPELDRPPTREDPAQAWIIGDSFVELFGPKLADEFSEHELIDPEVDFEFTSGLNRPDFFDWPAHIQKRMRSDPPDIVVMMFGGNDAQSVNVEGVAYEAFTPRWWDMYRARVEEVMDAVRGNRLAYWVGLPIMKDPEFRAHAKQFNEVYRTSARERPWMRYVSSWEVFTDENGNYADYLPNLNGDLRLMRYEDGAHFTPSGALELALHVSAVIEKEWRVPSDADEA